MACETSLPFFEEGREALENCDYLKATAFFSRALAEDNYNDSEYWCALAESYFYQAEFEQSLYCWKVAATKNPLSRKVWIKISALYALLQQEELASYYYRLSEAFPIDS
jgi:tetratricopeptide (TPR) repeat protein